MPEEFMGDVIGDLNSRRGQIQAMDEAYGARIVNGNGSQYEVAWDDGSPNLWIGAHQIRA